MKYRCVACGEYSVVIEEDRLKEAMENGCKWLYVYCRNLFCGALHHHDDVIASHEFHMKQRKLQEMTEGTVH